MASEETRDPELEALLEFMKEERGFDFTGYKRPSLTRRIGKRMQKLGIEDYEGYRRYLERDEAEFAQLFDTILINVTSFFRDPPAWDYVRAEILPRIVREREGEQIRVWSTGCATGEEAYTIAMVLAEEIGTDEFHERVKIYATDADGAALEEGRHAVYSAKAVEPVPPELLERYFERTDSRYAFRPDLRRSVIFGRHDVIRDPPISRIDLLVSRNTLMYFDVQTQRRILGNFYFSLNPDGYLFLGKSEVMLSRTSLFAPVDLRRRVFAKVVGTGFPERPPVPTVPPPARVEDERVRRAAFELSPAAQVVVDAAGTVVGINQHARTMFNLNQRDVGRPLQDLELSYRPVELRSRIDQAHAEGHPLALRDVEWRPAPEDVRVLDLQVTPLVSRSGVRLGTALAFSDLTRFRRLRTELEESRRQMETAYEELQSTVEELETTNEELQSTNEELETTNEELQSTNEELETMNEEMQSTNEELETMNDELRLRTDELNDANAFLDSVLASLAVAVVVVDADLRVVVWNSQAEALWGLRFDEVAGEHLLNLDLGLPLGELRDPIRRALAGEEPAPVVVEAIERRGRPVRCRVTFAARRSTLPASDARGVILLMEREDGDG